LRTLNSKGQIFSVELIFAVIVFLLILLLFLNVSLSTTQKIGRRDSFNERYFLADNALQQLLWSSGNPSNWQNLSSLADVNSLGLAESKNYLSKQKVQRLVDLNSSSYSEVKALLGLNNYGMHFAVYDFDGVLLKEFGLSPSSESESVVIERFAFYDGSIVKVKLEAFK